MTQTHCKPAARRGKHAVSLLEEENEKVQKLFAQFTELAKGDHYDIAKAGVVMQICAALTVNAQIEEAFYILRFVPPTITMSL
jgi:hypothetical protein